MGFQFQSVAATSTHLIEALAIDYATLGTLIGIYMLPGVMIALPGGMLAGRFGDKQVALLGLALMVVGGIIMAVGDSVMVVGAGRLVTGVGAVLFNVVATKMVTDWFIGREIVTAMAILLASWPLGIGAALASLSAVAEEASLTHAMLVPAVVCLVTAIGVAIVYRSPTQIGGLSSPPQAGPVVARRPTTREFRLICWAGLIWTTYNAGYIIVISFAPDYLTELGFSAAGAGLLMSVITWMLLPTVPFLGAIAERIDRPMLVMALTFAISAAAILAVPVLKLPTPFFVITAIAFAMPAGVIMSLPGAILRPESRAIGTGVFFTWYYAGMAGLPPVAGLARDMTGNAAAPVIVGGLVMAATLIWLAFLGLSRFRPPART
jgi:predicted MFS family arabinose efflux permease